MASLGSKSIRALGALLLLCVALLLALTGCNNPAPEDADTTEDAPAIIDCSIIYDPEFGGMYIQKTIEEANDLGFVYGDSVDISFSNGYVLEDIPYYNGYYNQPGEPLLVAYPGYDYIKAVINSGDDFWVVAGLDEDCTATVTLRQQGKYLAIQNARDISYEDDRDLFESDEQFANFRSIQAGNITENLVYRSASPCDNQHLRAPYVDALIQQAGVATILNLADSDDKIEGYISGDDFASPYFLSLYRNGTVKPLAMNMNYGSDEFRAKVVEGLRFLAQNDGPYLIHCTEGKDRTGFVCMLIEALCGASYQEIVDDYMLTYANYYGITQDEQGDKYQAIVESVLDPMLREIVGDETVDIETADLTVYATRYLSDAGMHDAEIADLVATLTQ